LTIAAIVLDIEGTTTPIAFVHDVLFPFARAGLRSYLQDERHADEVREVVALLKTEHATDVVTGARPPLWQDASREELLESVEAYARWLMDRDRKSPGLKQLQGQIWEIGYRAGALKGDVFPDTAPAIRRWRQAGLDVAIYSSGSVLAQRRLFESTPDGNLTGLITAFFDTAAGPKTSRDSYVRIAQALGHEPSQILFISDVTAELAAARAAGYQVRLSVRPGNPPQPGAAQFESMESMGDGLEI
jgi:enolase-phosphatase E1